MALLSNRKQNANKKNGGNQNGDKKANPKKQTLYVTVSSHKAVFLVTGDVRESKYSYGVPIIPLHGYYYSPKQKRTFTAKELSDYYTVLNLPKDIDEDTLNDVKVSKIVVVGYSANEVYVDEPDEEREDAGEREGEGEEAEEEIDFEDEDEKKVENEKGDRRNGVSRKK